MSITPVILCGGSGTRLWPLSREHYPKQLLSLVDEENSLLQSTVKRVDGLSKYSLEVKKPIVVSNETHRFLVAEQLREAGLTSTDILLEPAGRNTAPACSLAALHATKDQQDTLLLVMPADHVILKEDAFLSAVSEGADLASKGYLVTFGIVPTHAETGYGYIKKGDALSDHSSKIDAFVEKPDLATATHYLKSGDYFWNSGIFLFSAKTWLEAMDRFRPDINTAVRNAYEKGKQDYDFFRVQKKDFMDCPSESIDYAVMEKVTETGAPKSTLQAAVIPLDAGWSDVGSWQSLWDVGNKDAAGNLIKGDVLLHDTKNSMIFAENRVVAGIGIEHLIVIETADAVLVADKSASQEVKTIVNQLKSAGRSEALMHRRVFRPWGSYEGIGLGERYQVKRITVNPGAALSLQMHHHRAEHWIVVKGTAQVTRGEKTFLLSENESTYIPIGEKHRLENPGAIPLEIVEVQSGGYLGEDDIVRFEDQYGRDSSS